jgi:hypothetical protein
MPEEDPRRRYTANLQGEVDSAALYRTLAQTEKNPQLAQVYDRLAAIEEAHAEYWRNHIAAIDQRVPKLLPGFRARALAWLARRFGPAFVLPTVDTLEHIDSGIYDTQLEAIAGGLPAAARAHARLPPPQARRAQRSTLARLRAGMREWAATPRAVPVPMMGCLQSELVLGVAGADSRADDPRNRSRRTPGGSCSMALGEWLSVNTAREPPSARSLLRPTNSSRCLRKRRKSCRRSTRRMKEDSAKSLAEQPIANKKTALDTLVREELGNDPEELGGLPMQPGTSFHYLRWAIFRWRRISRGDAGIFASLVASGSVPIGAGTTLFTGRGVCLPGARQLLVGSRRRRCNPMGSAADRVAPTS